jgi:ATP-dependent protease HslVU (ClpYQ) peptidase subunit
LTCIVGLVEKGAVWMGGDSLVVRDGLKVTLAVGKVAHRGEFLLGTCGNHRLLSLARHVFEPPPLVAEADVDAYMAKEFAEAWRACLKDAGALTVENGYETQDGMMMVGVRGGGLYEIDGGFGVMRTDDNCGAIGSGDNIALGALFATPELDPERRILRALEAAEKWNDGVRGPFTVESIGEGKGAK